MERPGPEENPCCREVQLRKQLLLLATLVVCITYVAGNNPPGGVGHEDGLGYYVGQSICLTTNPIRYRVFFYSNTTAHAASVVAVFLLLLKKPRQKVHLILLRVFIILGLLGLIGAYVAGSSLDDVNTFSIITLAAILLLVLFRVILSCSTSRALQEERRQEEEEEDEESDVHGHAPLKPEERRKVLMLLATFVAAITYIAGLSLSGGYWDRVESRNQQADNGLNPKAMLSLIYFNSTAFIASLCAVVLLLTKKGIGASARYIAVYVCILMGLLGLLGAYAAGTYTHVYALCLIAAFLAYIALVIVMINTAWWRQSSSEDGVEGTDGGEKQEESVLGNTIRRDEPCRKVKSFVVMLAALVAAITYQSGLHPPGGFWPDDRDGHRAGEPIILSTHPWRYRIFLYCNSGAFLSSLSAIFTPTVHKEKIHTMLLLSVIVDMVALMGAYAAGTWRDAWSSIYIIFIAITIVVVLCVMIHLLCVTLCTTDMDYERMVKKRHMRLLLVTNLLLSITYQAGLNPPGGFRHQKENAHSAGAALLMDSHPSLFSAVFYCNTVSFMATMALILFFLVSPNQYRLGARWYALYTCIVLALLGLMAAYAVGITINTSADEIATVIAVFAIVVSVIGAHTIQSRSFLLREEEEDDGSSTVGGPVTIPRPRPRHIHRPRTHRTAQETKYRQVYASHKNLMLLGILAACATYQAGLNPPGGLWRENGDHGVGGSPVLYDRNRRRYHAFFYSNSTSFVASVFVVTLQLQQILLWRHQLKYRKLLVQATNTALMLDLLGLVSGYAVGASNGWADAIANFVLVLFCVTIHAAPWIQGTMFSWMHHCKVQLRTEPCITEQTGC